MPTSGYYLTLGGTSSSGSRTVTRSAVTDAHTAGYIPAKAATTVIAQDSKTVSIGAGSKTRYLTLPSASLANASTDGVTYTENKALTLTAGGYLYINHGYIPDTKISLSQLIPDFDSDATAGYIRSGYKAYSDAGEVITGTLADLSLSSTYYTTTNTGYGIVTGDRYNASTQYIKAGSASINVSATSSSITPTLDIVDIANSDGSTGSTGDIYSSLENAGTSKPESGYYFAINNTATSTTVNANPSVTKGWIESITGTSSASVSVSAQTKYIKVDGATQKAEVTALTAPTVNVTATLSSGLTASSSETKYAISLASTENAGSVKAKYSTTGAGYVSTTSTATSSATSINPVVKLDGTEQSSKTIYLPEGSCTVSGGGLSLSSSNTTSADPGDTGYARIASDSATSNYVKVLVTRAAVSDTHTAGYIEAGSNNAAIASTTKTIKIPATSANSIAVSSTNASASISLGSSNNIQ